VPRLASLLYGAARGGAHCHKRQAPPIRARLGSVSRSGDNPGRSYPYMFIKVRLRIQLGQYLVVAVGSRFILTNLKCVQPASSHHRDEYRLAETHGLIERHPLAAGDAEEGVLPGLGSRSPLNLLLIGLAKTHCRRNVGFYFSLLGTGRCFEIRLRRMRVFNLGQDCRWVVYRPPAENFFPLE
jgi:hypothetical protein